MIRKKCNKIVSIVGFSLSHNLDFMSMPRIEVSLYYYVYILFAFHIRNKKKKLYIQSKHFSNDGKVVAEGTDMLPTL